MRQYQGVFTDLMIETLKCVCQMLNANVDMNVKNYHDGDIMLAYCPAINYALSQSSDCLFACKSKPCHYHVCIHTVHELTCHLVSSPADYSNSFLFLTVEHLLSGSRKLKREPSQQPCLLEIINVNHPEHSSDTDMCVIQVLNS